MLEYIKCFIESPSELSSKFIIEHSKEDSYINLFDSIQISLKSRNNIRTELDDFSKVKK